MSRVDGKMTRVENKMSRVQKYVWKHFSSWQKDPDVSASVSLFSAFRTFSFFTTCDSEFKNNTRSRRSFKGVLISECFFFFNLPFNVEKHLMRNQYIKEGGIMELQRHTTLTTTEVELIDIINSVWNRIQSMLHRSE